MTKSTKTLEFKFERTIPASPGEVYDAWLNPKIPGNPWNAAEKFMLDPKVDGLFYWTLKGTPHYVSTGIKGSQNHRSEGSRV
jgi:uncharacterized protein YndB with AHSA1/START domain